MKESLPNKANGMISMILGTISIASLFITIGIFLQRVNQVEAKQESLEASVGNMKIGERLASIEAILNERLPATKNK